MKTDKEFKVLLVEDNPDHAMIARMTLEKIEKISTIDHVDDGKKALNYLFHDRASAKALPNLTILDLNLPEFDGFEVLKEIRKHELLSGLPVVVLTTSRNDSDVRKAIDLGIIEYFVKPLDKNRLSEILESLGEIGNLKNKSTENLNWLTMSFIS
ncbi:MAG: response regulator [Candidatus Delongbacteria bacterium]|nr:response regulator [Candidatus Delongbacteria bacterium]